jgi:CRP/FNR family transcriptional regulator
MSRPLPADAPFLQTLDPVARQVFAARAVSLSLHAGDPVFRPGQAAEAFIIVTGGRVRVRLIAENGREIVLYRVEAGESCVLTTSHLLDNELHAADALCETDVAAIALPRTAFRELMATSETFRETVLSAYAARVSDLILTIEETQFQRVDARLAALLRERAVDGLLEATHQSLAVELGTAREVVSRTLKRFERAGAINLRRGAIMVTDAAALARLADSPP